MITQDIQYISKQELAPIADKIVEIHKMISGLIKSNKKNRRGKD